MSAQKGNQPSTSQSISRTEPGGRQTSLMRRDFLPSVPSLLLDPLGFFDDSPFSLLRRMQQEMNRAFGQPGLTSRGAVSNGVWVPPIEVAYRDGNLVVSAELPGLKDEDISVAVRDDAIVIEGERQIEHEENEEGIHRTELRYGQFYREIPLPDGAQTDQARAEFRDGILQVSVPVPQEKRNERQIPIETAESSQSSQSSSKADQNKTTSSEPSEAKKAA
ncbi:MAG TPA: Hsp20/alpha crystallin family protein [Candidatus Deferrimicrobiaceae bacterium]|nr:Hsp20/alpha crystallin family protein [Candidatus Deferrimicrobiaceae bacterium]